MNKLLITYCIVWAISARVEQGHEQHQFEVNGIVRQLSDDDFDSAVSNSDKPIIIMFYAHWCTHCYEQFPFWKEVAEKYKSKYNFAAVECHENEDLRDRMSILTFPTYTLINKDKIKYTYIGKRKLPEISDWIDNQKWKNSKEVFEEIPDSVTHTDYFKRVVRRIFSIKGSILIMTLLSVFIIAFLVFDYGQHKKEKQELNKRKEIVREREIEREIRKKSLNKLQ